LPPLAECSRHAQSDENLPENVPESLDIDNRREQTANVPANVISLGNSHPAPPDLDDETSLKETTWSSTSAA
jgi:hypothetical protein